ncbi:hypothetical protein [Lactococcus cremoris]|nr:hypothetical protein [Lactococcus cremoris]KZK06045.1 hypothetical protein V4_2237 [Lactococcus cremoris]BDE08507.1 hypothetical protein Llc71_02020 [Lactococcus cremoris]
MTEKSMKNLVKVTGILNIIGATLVVLSTIVSMASLSKHSIQLVQTALKPDLMQQILALLCLSKLLLGLWE